MEKIAQNQDYNWYAVYVKSRTERKAEIELRYMNIEAFLPLQRKLRQWSDRKKWVELPLISGYLFVRISRMEYDRVLQSNHIVSYVRFEGKAAIIPDKQIEFLKLMLNQDVLDIELVQEDFSPGQMIEIISGPLIGLQGKLIRTKGKDKLAVELGQLGYSVLVEIASTNVRIMGSDQEALQ